MKEFKNQLSFLELPELLPKQEITKTTACFTGHRNIPEEIKKDLKNALEKQILALYIAGIKKFYCGGAVGFDMLAGFSVLKLRQCHKDISLILALPDLEQEKYYLKAEKEQYYKLLKQSNDIHLIFKKNVRLSYLERDKYMVDKSDICIAYCIQNKGGTAYTVRYAERRNKPVINLAKQI